MFTMDDFQQTNIAVDWSVLPWDETCKSGYVSDDPSVRLTYYAEEDSLSVDFERTKRFDVYLADNKTTKVFITEVRFYTYTITFEEVFCDETDIAYSDFRVITREEALGLIESHISGLQRRHENEIREAKQLMHLF